LAKTELTNEENCKDADLPRPCFGGCLICYYDMVVDSFGENLRTSVSSSACRMAKRRRTAPPAVRIAGISWKGLDSLAYCTVS